MKCLLCDETRCLERAHIVPQLLTRYIKNVSNNRCFVLCPTHHRCYDKFQLSSAEMQVLKAEVIGGMSHMVTLYHALRSTNSEQLEVTRQNITAWVRQMYGAVYA